MRKISRYVCTYFITAMLLIGCLLAAASIPRSAIEKNASASAEFLAADPAVFHSKKITKVGAISPAKVCEVREWFASGRSLF